MKIVRPVVINDAMLSASSISEDDYDAWSVTTTYGTGDRVIFVAADMHMVLESAANANLAYSPAVAANIPTWWLLVGSTNRWRMFDSSPSNQASALSQIAVTVAPGERIDTVTLLNVSANSVTITQTDPVDGVVYNATTSLVATSGIVDWYAYFFEPIVRINDFSIEGLFPYTNASVTITLDDAGETVLCGECVLGLSREIGGTQYGVQVGIQDYSVKAVDVWGNAEITERAYAKRADFAIWVEPELVDELQSLLAGYRATPALYIGDDGYKSTVVYGFYKDFGIEIAYVSISLCTLSVEGLA